MTFDAELDRMHTACDDAFGVGAMFRPVTGAAFKCRVEKQAPSPVFGPGEAQAVAADIVLSARRSAFGQTRPKRGDIFELLAADGVTVSEKLRVCASATVEDDDDKRFSIPVERVS